MTVIIYRTGGRLPILIHGQGSIPIRALASGVLVGDTVFSEAEIRTIEVQM